MRVIIFFILIAFAWSNKSFNRSQIIEINHELQQIKNLIKKGNYSVSKEKLESIQSKYPDLDTSLWWSNYHRSLGYRKTKQKNFYEAALQYRKAFEHKPSEITLNSLATAYIQNKQFFDASNLLESNSNLVSEKNKVKYEQRIAFTYAKMQNFQGAIYRTKNLINLEPNNPKHWSALSQYYMKNGQPEEALDALDRLSSIRPLKYEEKRLKVRASQKNKLGNQHDVAVSSSFEVQLDNELYREHLPTVLRILNQAYMELGRIFNFYPELKTRVNILTNQNYIHASGNKFSIGMRTRSSDEIYIKLDESNNFENPNNLRNTIWHEYNHHLLLLKSNSMGEIPHWFIEGVAMYLEPKELSIRDLKIMTTLIKSDFLFTSDTLPVRIKNYQMYLMARSMVEYLDQEGYLSNILDNLNELTFSYKFTDLFEEIVGMDQLTFTDQWNSNIKAKQIPQKPN